jgi:hypothetical protein
MRALTRSVPGRADLPLVFRGLALGASLLALGVLIPVSPWHGPDVSAVADPAEPTGSVAWARTAMITAGVALGLVGVRGVVRAGRRRRNRAPDLTPRYVPPRGGGVVVVMGLVIIAATLFGVWALSWLLTGSGHRGGASPVEAPAVHPSSLHPSRTVPWVSGTGSWGGLALGRAMEILLLVQLVAAMTFVVLYLWRRWRPDARDRHTTSAAAGGGLATVLAAAGDRLGANMSRSAGQLEAIDARATVIEIYASLQESMVRGGLIVQRSDTPEDVLARLAADWPGLKGEATLLTDLFQRARFGNDALPARALDQAAACMRRLVEGLSARPVRAAGPAFTTEASGSAADEGGGA